jgi:hypothetical protein
VVEVEADRVVVRHARRSHHPILREAALDREAPAIPWLQGRNINLTISAGHCPEALCRAGLSDRAIGFAKPSRLGRPLVNSETVVYSVKGTTPPKKVVGDLRQPEYIVPWQVQEYREQSKE